MGFHKKLSKVSGLATATLMLFACGGGGGTDSVLPTPAPVAPIAPVTPQEPEQCENVQHTISSASDDGSFSAPYAPELVIDGDTSPESRWSSEGTSKAITLDLGEDKEIGALKI